MPDADHAETACERTFLAEHDAALALENVVPFRVIGFAAAARGEPETEADVPTVVDDPSPSA